MILERRDEAAGIQVEEGLRLVVGVDFDVLVLNTFFFEGDPNALDEGAEPAGVEFQGVGRLVGLLGSVRFCFPAY